MSAERFQRLGKRVSVVIFYGATYNYGPHRDHWRVQVKFEDKDAKIELEESNAFIGLALENVYNRLDQIVSNGIGASAMLPAIEHKSNTSDEEIPF